MSMKVFLSHAWSDKKLASFKAIETKLRDSGYEVWVDKQGIEFGARVTDAIDEALAATDIVLVLWSESARDSQMVRHEIETTLRLGKPLVPCRIGSLRPDEYEPLKDRKYLRFDTNLDFGLLQMSQFLARLRASRDPRLSGDADLMNQMAALNDALVEAEDSLYRRASGVSGNQASGTYIRAMLDAGKKLVSASSSTSPEEKSRMTRFMSMVQEIAQVPSDQADDAAKTRRMVEAIGAADPRGESETLQAFRRMLAGLDSAGESAASPAPPAPAAAAPPPATPLHAYIAAVRGRAGAEIALRRQLESVLPDAAQVAAHERALGAAVDAIPDLLAALADASMRAGIGELVAPLLAQAQGYFFAENDLIPDHAGTLGLLDDAYLVHAFLYQINAVYQAQTGVPLVAYDATPTLMVLRAVLGPMITNTLDQAVVAAVNGVVQQNYYTQLSRQQASLNIGGSRTGGPGAWGGSVEDEIARLGAELGISMP